MGLGIYLSLVPVKQPWYIWSKYTYLYFLHGPWFCRVFVRFIHYLSVKQYIYISHIYPIYIPSIDRCICDNWTSYRYNIYWIVVAWIISCMLQHTFYSVILFVPTFRWRDNSACNPRDLKSQNGWASERLSLIRPRRWVTNVGKYVLQTHSPSNKRNAIHKLDAWLQRMFSSTPIFGTL